MGRANELYKPGSIRSSSLFDGFSNLLRHSSCSRDEQAVMSSSYSWESHSKTSFQEKGAV